jgi:exopolysaccharide biosynthesis polyprenyl glycosylphosphotransferase
MLGIKSQPNIGYHLVGYLEDRSGNSPRQIHHPHLGNIDELQGIVQKHHIHQVILALPFWQNGRLPELVQACRNLRIDFRIAPDLYALSFDRVDVLQFSGVPLLGLKEVSIKGWNLALKRALDVALIVLSAPVSVPFSLLVALLIRLDSPGPALFRQQRIGKGGKQFTCYKFRTMVADAEARRAALEALNEADGPIFKMRRDPRVTRMGRFLRRSSLDELPQLWNVLRGEMSLVGPRPALPSEVELYEPWHRRRLEVTPGMTGLWQVLGRSNTTFDEMVQLDIYYAENWSVSVDMRILLKTIPAVLSSHGAY